MRNHQRSLTADLTRCRLTLLHGQASEPAPRRDRPPETVVVERPWGSFEQFACNEAVTVKVITVQPGQRLSLQLHEHRSELWQVLDGPLDVSVGNCSWSARTGECVWVPQGETHRIGNSRTRPARVLEVAFGVFDEEDIHRIEDDYAR